MMDYNSGNTSEGVSNVVYTTPTTPITPEPAAPEPAQTTEFPYPLGANRSSPDPRDYYVSQFYATLPKADVNVSPPALAGGVAPLPLSSADLPLTTPLVQIGGSCVAYGFAGAMQHTLWTVHKQWYDLDVEEFFLTGGGNPTYGWEIREALVFAQQRGIYTKDHSQIFKVKNYYKVPQTELDVMTAIYQGSRGVGLSPVLWETAWPWDWFNPAAGTGLLTPGGGQIASGHLTYGFRYVPRIFGATGVCMTGRQSWGYINAQTKTYWGVNSNYEVQMSDVIGPLCWGIYTFTI